MERALHFSLYITCGHRHAHDAILLGIRTLHRAQRIFQFAI